MTHVCVLHLCSLVPLQAGLSFLPWGPSWPPCSVPCPVSVTAGPAVHSTPAGKGCAGPLSTPSPAWLGSARWVCLLCPATGCPSERGVLPTRATVGSKLSGDSLPPERLMGTPGVSHSFHGGEGSGEVIPAATNRHFSR